MMGPGFQGGWMNNVPVMMLVVVQHECVVWCMDARL